MRSMENMIVPACLLIVQDPSNNWTIIGVMLWKEWKRSIKCKTWSVAPVSSIQSIGVKEIPCVFLTLWLIEVLIRCTFLVPHLMKEPKSYFWLSKVMSLLWGSNVNYEKWDLNCDTF